jgi:hypothetical protein
MLWINPRCVEFAPKVGEQTSPDCVTLRIWLPSVVLQFELWTSKWPVLLEPTLSGKEYCTLPPLESGLEPTIVIQGLSDSTDAEQLAPDPVKGTEYDPARNGGESDVREKPICGPLGAY